MTTDEGSILRSRLVQEYDQGKPTGDRVCTTCGKTFSHTEADSWKRQEGGQKL